MRRSLAILAATAADLALGDPRRLHPVGGFGTVAAGVERILWRRSRLAGTAYTALLVGGAGELGARLPAAVVLWTALGGRSLAREATALAGLLERGDLDGARLRARSLVGRDTAALDEPELCRAAVESVAENTADAVVGPLLWCALAGARGAAAYRAANTLDACVGYRSERYARFGWASARLEDLLTWPAARLGAALAVVLAPLAGGDPARTWRTLRRDGAAHPSPNAGRLEAAFAGALGVRLGGLNHYAWASERRPELGDGERPGPADVRRAARLSLAVGVAAAALAAGLAW